MLRARARTRAGTRYCIQSSKRVAGTKSAGLNTQRLSPACALLHSLEHEPHRRLLCPVWATARHGDLAERPNRQRVRIQRLKYGGVFLQLWHPHPPMAARMTTCPHRRHFVIYDKVGKQPVSEGSGASTDANRSLYDLNRLTGTCEQLMVARTLAWLEPDGACTAGHSVKAYFHTRETCIRA